jgi:hypothetical protein
VNANGRFTGLVRHVLLQTQNERIGRAHIGEDRMREEIAPNEALDSLTFQRGFGKENIGYLGGHYGHAKSPEDR